VYYKAHTKFRFRTVHIDFSVSFEVCTIQAITENIMQFGHVRASSLSQMALNSEVWQMKLDICAICYNNAGHSVQLIYKISNEQSKLKKYQNNRTTTVSLTNFLVIQTEF
jgi:hypothetical protein